MRSCKSLCQCFHIFTWTSSKFFKVLGVCFSSLEIREVSYCLQAGQAGRTKQSLASIVQVALRTYTSLGRAGSVQERSHFDY